MEARAPPFPRVELIHKVSTKRLFVEGVEFGACDKVSTTSKLYTPKPFNSELYIQQTCNSTHRSARTPLNSSSHIPREKASKPIYVYLLTDRLSGLHLVETFRDVYPQAELFAFRRQVWRKVCHDGKEGDKGTGGWGQGGGE